MTLSRFVPAAVVLLVGTWASSARAEDAKLTAARKQAQECGDATIQGDYEKLVDLTHPSAVKLAGGKQKLIDLLTTSMGELKKQGFAFETFKVDPVQTSTKNGDSTYCVLPTTIKLKVDKKKITQRSYLLGISADDGKTWKFLEGAQGEAGLRKLLPEIPKELKFPDPVKPVIEDEEDK